jgi:hypothetical protein
MVAQGQQFLHECRLFQVINLACHPARPHSTPPILRLLNPRDLIAEYWFGDGTSREITYIASGRDGSARNDSPRWRASSPQTNELEKAPNMAAPAQMPA